VDTQEEATLLLAIGARHGWPEVVEYALSKQADLSGVERLLNRAAGEDGGYLAPMGGMDAVHAAAEKGHVNVLRVLQRNGVGMSSTGGSSERSALHRAAANGHADVVRFLLECGADPSCRDRYGYTPLHYAAKSGAVEATEVLISAGARVNATATDGFTPLLMATENDRPEVVSLLMQSGANAQARIGGGNRPDASDIAKERGYAQCLRYLQRQGGDEPPSR